MRGNLYSVTNYFGSFRCTRKSCAVVCADIKEEAVGIAFANVFFFNEKTTDEERKATAVEFLGVVTCGQVL